MTPLRGIVLAIALVSAVAAALIVRGMAQSQDKPQPQMIVQAPAAPKPSLQVLVAKRDLAIGERITEDMLTWQNWASEGLNPAFITRPAEQGEGAAAAAGEVVTAAKTAVQGDPAKANLVGSVVREAVIMGEPIMSKKLVRAGEAGVMAVALDPGMRAIAIPLSAQNAAGGFILPGDHVDVVQSRRMEGGLVPNQLVASTVMRNVRVLAIDQNNTRSQKEAAVLGATATLEVSPPQAEALVLAKMQGELTLTLRSYADARGPTLAGGSMLDTSGVNAVRVYRDGAATDVMVSR
jgi:pilus assembly protein CpaB